MRVLATLMFCVVSIGCGEDGGSLPTPDTYEVKGTVTVDGEPLPTGVITFSSPEDAQLGLGAATGEIVDGTYDVNARAGNKQVKISLREEFGEGDETGVKLTRETISAEFNENTRLEAEIKAEGENTFDFEVTTRNE